MYYLIGWPLVKTLWHMNSSNWWKSKDEPFFTNESIVCAFFCWFIWIFFWTLLMTSLYALIFRYDIFARIMRNSFNYKNMKASIVGYDEQFSLLYEPKKFTNSNCFNIKGDGFSATTKSGETLIHCLLCVKNFNSSDEVV